MRSGQFIKQVEGYTAFIPAPLPPNPPIDLNGELNRLLSDADRSLGRLDGATSILPNPDHFVLLYIIQEAVLSSQIEGTQSTLEDVLQFKINAIGQERLKNTKKVVNYVKAIQYGLRRLESLPLSLRLIREIHTKLLEGVKSSEPILGEFRTRQNWIGSQVCTINTASFVPPPVAEMNSALYNLEKFLHQPSYLPVLIHCGIVHGQFETIHPFLDGNGRIGRLLITLLLSEKRILQKPLLYLSYYLKYHQNEYYARLMAIRTHGDWEGWLKFFLKGVVEVSESARQKVKEILNLREQHREIIGKKITSSDGLRLLDFLFDQPLINIKLVEEYLDCSYVTANKIVSQFQELALLVEVTGWKRNRLYRYEPYLKIFDSLY